MFTREDLDFLYECIEAKERDASTSSLMGTMMKTMMARTKEEAEKFIHDDELKMKEQKEAGRALRDRCILFKAKLIQMRDEHDAEAFMRRASQPVAHVTEGTP